MPTLPPRSASLQPFFTPRGVAVIGASRDPGKLSYGVLRNLTDPQHGFPGPVYPVNPKADEILGRRCYPDISQVPDPVDLAILIIPAGSVPATVEACGQRGIQAAVIISGGFREVGPEGAARERQVVEIARRYGMRLMGPNGIGVIDTHTPLDTTFVRGMPERGGIAFLSQSGALCGGVIDWVVGRGIGFSRLLSVGNEADVNETDALPFLAEDPETSVITLYLEDVKGGPAFTEALRQAARRKPVLAIKTGRTQSGQAATASHTGALAGAHAAFRAACRQAGAIEVEQIESLFNGALALDYQPLPQGDRVALLTNAGGPAALAADALEAAGLSLARPTPETQAALRSFLLPEAQVGGPVDLLGGATEVDYRRSLEAVLADPGCDAVLAILVPQVLVDSPAVVQALAEVARAQAGQKPVVACLMGEASLEEAYRAAHRGRLPAYTFPEQAVAALGVLRQRARWEAAPHPEPVRPVGTHPQRTRAIISPAREERRTVLNVAEGIEVLAAYGLPWPFTGVADTPDAAAEIARKIGFPVALKLASLDILHKTDVGGVMLNVPDEAAARQGFETILARARAAHPQARLDGVQVQEMVHPGREVILGIKRDPTFGPLVLFGMGGVYVEALADVSIRLAPLTRPDAEAMIAEVRSARLLEGLRGEPPADREALINALLRLSWLAADCPEIAELDINPLIVHPAGRGAVAADVRIILEG